MKIIERYVLQAFLAAFFLAWLVLSFVLSIGLLVRIARLLIEGLPLRAIGLFLLVGLPETLTLTIHCLVGLHSWSLAVCRPIVRSQRCGRAA